MWSAALLVVLVSAPGVFASSTRTYTYDALGRLRSVTASGDETSVQTYDYDAAGNRTQTKSKSESISPSAPTNLSATVVSGSQINLSWSPSTDTGGSGLAGYKIYRGGSQIATRTTTSYSDSSLTYGTTYTYWVVAYDADDNPSAQSNSDSATTIDLTPPSTPTGLSATPTSPSRINLSWNKSSDTGGSGLAGYRIYRGGSLIASTTTNSYSNTGLPSSTTYSYRVAAYDHEGNPSGQSTSVSATTWPPVVATLSTSAWRWIKRGTNAPRIDEPVVCTGSGGSGFGYTYAWQRVSGDAQTTAVSPASSSTRWTRDMPYQNATYTSTWRCLVTDSGGNTGQNTVTVTFTLHTLQ
jgi:hypothetical protein